ncbi:hypothetical protein KY285_023565 [Solanum tuberosum]|nr:hypothetical protein KY289_023896 [Solanum tuberosum]KAH0675764.1 hypothetical protein KY285_023565 [Solanum tuberosum]
MDQIIQSDLSDKPWWTNTSSGQFSVKSAWDIIRKREEEADFNKKIWVQDCETVKHLFLKGEVADTVWKYFAGAAGLLGPCVQWKCNKDGASRGNPAPSSIGFCVRNSFGDIVGAKGLRIQDTTNLVDDAITLKEGLQFEVENGFTLVITESGSLSMINIINGVWKVPWSVTLEVNSFTRMRICGQQEYNIP